MDNGLSSDETIEAVSNQTEESQSIKVEVMKQDYVPEEGPGEDYDTKLNQEGNSDDSKEGTGNLSSNFSKIKT